MIPVFDDWRATPAAWKGGAVALGNFDGVHRGHQALLAHTGQRARALGAPLVTFTFEPVKLIDLRPRLEGAARPREPDGPVRAGASGGAADAR